MKSALITLSAICCLSFASCKKDFSCTCKINVDLGTGGAPISLSQVTKIEKTNKKGAEATCDNIGAGLGSTVGLLGATVDCTID